MGLYDERTRPTKMQAAVLRAAQAASERTGTPGCVEERLFEWIVRHFFRESRVLQAVEQLRRMGYVSHGPRGRLDLRVPDCAWGDGLAGDDPNPLSDVQLHEIIAGRGYAIAVVATENTGPRPVPAAAKAPERKERKPRSVSRRFVLLADHLLAESWYRGPLPSPLSKAIIVVDKSCEAALLALRSVLAHEGMMESFPDPTGRHERRWHVTPKGVAYCERSGTGPSLSVDRIHAIATRLGYEPIPRGGHLGR